MATSSPSGIPGMGPMTDTLDFVKKLWGGMSVPGMVVPTVSVDELEQKIADLKTVESWLNLNMTMLRNTIQTLEIQRATLATIQSVGAAMGAAMKPGEDGAPAFPFPFSMSGAAGPASADSVPNPFSYPNWPAPAPKPGAAPNTQAGPSGGNGSASSAPGRAGSGDAAPARDGAAAGQPGAAPAGSPDFAAAMAVPNAWWNMLQGQFLQAVGQAMSDGTPQPAADATATSTSSAAAGDSQSGKGERQAKGSGNAGSEPKPAASRKPKS